MHHMQVILKRFGISRFDQFTALPFFPNSQTFGRSRFDKFTALSFFLILSYNYSNITHTA